MLINTVSELGGTKPVLHVQAVTSRVTNYNKDKNELLRNQGQKLITPQPRSKTNYCTTKVKNELLHNQGQKRITTQLRSKTDYFTNKVKKKNYSSTKVKKRITPQPKSKTNYSATKIKIELLHNQG